MFSNQTMRRVPVISALVAILALVNLLVLPALGQVAESEVSVVASDATATEAGLTTGELTFTRTGETGAALDVAYTVTGTATAGADYVALSGTLTFGIGESTATVLVTPIDDADVESDETVIVGLDASSAYSLGASAEATVVIEDDDEVVLPEVSVVASDATATEAGLTTGELTFTRTGETGAALDVAYTVTGTATAGADYVALSGTLTFGIGESTATVLVTPIDDADVESDETVIVGLDASSAYSLGTDAVATVTIIDDDEADDGDTGDLESLTKADCKKGGWSEFGVFKNQGDCVSFVATEGRNPPAGDDDGIGAAIGAGVASFVRATASVIGLDALLEL